MSTEQQSTCDKLRSEHAVFGLGDRYYDLRIPGTTVPSQPAGRNGRRRPDQITPPTEWRKRRIPKGLNRIDLETAGAWKKYPMVVAKEPKPISTLRHAGRGEPENAGSLVPAARERGSPDLTTFLPVARANAVGVVSRRLVAAVHAVLSGLSNQL